jgi:hypothetical protein
VRLLNRTFLRVPLLIARLEFSESKIMQSKFPPIDLELTAAFGEEKTFNFQCASVPELISRMLAANTTLHRDFSPSALALSADFYYRMEFEIDSPGFSRFRDMQVFIDEDATGRVAFLFSPDKRLQVEDYQK